MQLKVKTGQMNPLEDKLSGDNWREPIHMKKRAGYQILPTKRQLL